MKLLRITYENYDKYYEQLILVSKIPNKKTILKLINMYNYAGNKMIDQDYKYFVLELKNYVPYHITDIEELPFIDNI